MSYRGKATLQGAKEKPYALGPMQIETIFRKLGGIARVGALCGVSRQAVIQWKRIPAEHVLTIHRKSEEPITPHQMRRDLYPHPLDGIRRKRKPRRKARAQ